MFWYCEMKIRGETDMVQKDKFIELWIWFCKIFIVGYYGSLFSMETFKKILKDEELDFETDVNVCRYVNNEKELLNEEGRITVKKMQTLLNEKNATFQIHQPQRFSVSNRFTYRKYWQGYKWCPYTTKY